MKSSSRVIATVVLNKLPRNPHSNFGFRLELAITCYTSATHLLHMHFTAPMCHTIHRIPALRNQDRGFQTGKVGVYRQEI